MISARYEYLKLREQDVYELYQPNPVAIVGVFVSLVIIFSTAISGSSVYSTVSGFVFFVISITGISTPIALFDTNNKLITIGQASLANRFASGSSQTLQVPFVDAVVSLRGDTDVETNGKSSTRLLIQDRLIYGAPLVDANKVRAVYEEVLRLLNDYGCSNILQITVLPSSIPGDQILVCMNNRRYIYVLPSDVRPGGSLTVSASEMIEVEDDSVELMQVLVPEGKVAGDLILCADHFGNQFTAPVPPGQKAGNTFISQIATATAVPIVETVNSPTHEIPVATSSSPRFGQNRVVPAEQIEQVSTIPASTNAQQDRHGTERAEATGRANSSDLESSLQQRGVLQNETERDGIVITPEAQSHVVTSSLVHVQREAKVEERSDLETSTLPFGGSDSVTANLKTTESKAASEPVGTGQELQALLDSSIDKGATVETFCRDKTSLDLSLEEYESVLNSLDFDFQKTKVMETLLPKLATVKCAHLTAAIRIIIKDDLSFKMLQIIEAHAPYIEDKQNIENTLARLSLDAYDMKVARRHFNLDEKP